MSNILLFSIFAINLGGFCLLAMFFYILFRLFRQFKGFIQPAAEGKPSPFAEVVQAMADMVARSIVAQVKAVFMGKASGESRANQAAMSDLMADEAQAVNPLVGGLLQSFPSARKWLAKNPAALEYALSKLGNLGLNSSNHSGASGGASASPRFKL